MKRWAPLVLVLGITAAAFSQEVTTPDPGGIVGSPHRQPPADSALDDEAKKVAALLRCPVCQGLSVADSPVGLAVNMRRQVREMVAVGYDQEQILSYFEKSYGEFVRLKPPLRGMNWLVWAGPLAGLLLGGTIVFRVLRQPGIARVTGKRASEAALPGADTLPADQSLAGYVLRVREQAYGWPGGRSPGDEGTGH